jgi:hypothetical protein
MKKLLKAVAVAGVMVGMSGGVAFADTTCSGSISNTGPGSNNTVTCVTSNNESVKCENNIVVKNDNDQNANSGSASVDGNTTGGSATSGSASNSNSTVVKVGTSCAPVATSGGGGGGDFTVPPENPQVLGETTSAGGGGGGQVSAVPVGGAGAGTGSAANSDKTAATVGVIGSAGLVGLGLALRKRAIGHN